MSSFIIYRIWLVYACHNWDRDLIMWWWSISVYFRQGYGLLSYTCFQCHNHLAVWDQYFTFVYLRTTQNSSSNLECYLYTWGNLVSVRFVRSQFVGFTQNIEIMMPLKQKKPHIGFNRNVSIDACCALLLISYKTLSQVSWLHYHSLTHNNCKCLCVLTFMKHPN